MALGNTGNVSKTWQCLELVRRVEGLGHKQYTDSYFSSPALFDDLFGRKINSCGTVCSDRRGMPKDISS